MARIEGLERKQAPWHFRWSYGAMRKKFGKELTPAKIQMRLPAQVAFENFRARLNRVFGVGSDGLYTLG